VNLTDTVTIRWNSRKVLKSTLLIPLIPLRLKSPKIFNTFDETNGGNLDVNLVSLVTGEKEKTVSFGVQLKK